MAMVALNAARTKIVEKGSLEARWMVDEDDAAEYIKDATNHPRMQAAMQAAEERRLKDEEASQLMAAEMDAYRERVRRGLG